MTKKELIKALEDHPDDKEIYIWNGFVEDWMDFSTCGLTLVKERYQEVSRNIVREICYKNRNWKLPLSEIRKIYKKQKRDSVHWEWDTPNQYFSEKRYRDFYGDNEKKILLLDAKPRGKKAFDRLGDINY